MLRVHDKDNLATGIAAGVLRSMSRSCGPLTNDTPDPSPPQSVRATRRRALPLKQRRDGVDLFCSDSATVAHATGSSKVVRVFRATPVACEPAVVVAEACVGVNDKMRARPLQLHERARLLRRADQALRGVRGRTANRIYTGPAHNPDVPGSDAA